jgi:hypothetical protein
VAITGSNLGCTLANCVVISSSIILSGTTTAVSAGAVTFSTDRGSSGSATWTPGSGYTTAAITLKAGVNNVTIRSTDASGNAGTATIAITYTPTFPGNALVASYGFEDGSGTSATDSSGNSNTGTLTNGPTWITTGRYGKALSFNGTNQYVVASGTLNNTLNLTQSFTLSAWVQPAASFTTFKSIVHKNSDPVGSPYELYASVSGNCGSGSASGFTTVNGASGPLYAACNPTPLAVGVWTHLALIYDGAQLCLYKNADNTTKVCTAATGYMEPSTGSLQIGASEFGEYFQGLIDEVRVYNFAIPLTAASNTAAGASCTPTNFSDNNAVATASITGNMNCPVINLNPPSAFKLSAGATELKLGSSATAAKIGANP